ncbi:MAG: ABC transporter permease subunit [Culicoidibacterales bacterium]
MTLAKLEWQRGKRSIFVWSSAVIVMITLFMLVFPSMKDSGMQELVLMKTDALPENLMKIFNIEDMTKLLQITGYFSYVFQYMYIAAAIFATSLGMNTLVKEQTEGTIEYLYGQPISRADIIVSKFVANILMLYLFWLIVFLACIIIFIIFKNPEDNLGQLVEQLSRIFVSEGLVLTLFYAIGFSLSTIITSTKVVMSAALGLVFGTYTVGILATVNTDLDSLKYLSPLNYALPGDVMNKFMDPAYIVIIAIIVSCTFILSIFIYQKKDLKA